MDTFWYPAKFGLFRSLEGTYLIAAKVSRVLSLEGYVRYVRLLKLLKKTVSKSANRYATQTQWTCHLQHIITPVRLSEGVWSRLMIFSTFVCCCCFRWRSWIPEMAEMKSKERIWSCQQTADYLPTYLAKIFEPCLPTYLKRMTNGWPVCRA